jgi:hypothetical protein
MSETTPKDSDQEPLTGEDIDSWLIQMRDVAATWQDGDLYHYTTIDGLKGILDSGRLWGTHVAFLNDSQELRHGVDAICSLIKKYAEWHIDEPDPEPSETMHKTILSLHEYVLSNRDMLQTKMGLFVSCLSSSADQLSQWRGYGSHGGYAIRFDPKKLGGRYALRHVDEKGDTLKGPDPVLVKVNYLPNTFYDEVTKMVDACILGTADANKLEDGEEKEAALFSVRVDLFRTVIDIAPQIKHKKFVEEQEYRIITRGVEQFCTPSKIGLVPRVYVQFDRAAVEEVVVGPGEFEDVRKLSIERYLDQHRNWYPNVQVTPSEVPYREV